ncbi:Crp/Fnr family transcriptional regulator [Calidifontimicrobium sp. SYSU G02091]|uniref:Crp/Fnr family transcriptional regulator n=1 Tax=Calidifontimicrobium sp. SYSU G02091 TaxID=2926421 RepID=UPI001F5313E2|nr:Crp/Fnr family transcriptional regulator [Calidifontimicrobium sp. SYSU G02091]MCI1192448.1 Crp/Fnr family transcriptional regulator [Calidifontimicrobium sp. SYSU G02091]
MSTDTGTLSPAASARGVPRAATPPRAPLAAGPALPYPGGGERASPARRLAPALAALGVSAADAQALERDARTRLVAQGQPVFQRSNVAHTVVVLLQGDVALGVALADTQFRPERLVHAPAWLDLASAWLDTTFPLDARALSPVAVAEWPLDVLAPLIERRPTLARTLIDALAAQVRALALNTHELMHKDAPARLAAWLHQRCVPRPGVPGQAVVQLHERKRDIASQLAITPETLSRLMRSFMQQGVLEVSGYTVHVLDPAALAALADGQTAPCAG